eukprot:Clim_evm39s243 gene=Clim_evmTU39s243
MGSAVSRKLREAKEGKSKDLDLSGQNLKSIPAEVSLLKEHLQCLVVCRNQLKKCPASLNSLHLLYKLDLRWNRLREIPNEISQLRNLRVLLMGHNKVATWPPKEPEWMALLKKLDMSYNRITHLPPYLQNLAVDELSIEGNEIVVPPPSVWRRNSGDNTQVWIEGLQQWLSDNSAGIKEKDYTTVSRRAGAAMAKRNSSAEDGGRQSIPEEAPLETQDSNATLVGRKGSLHSNVSSQAAGNIRYTSGSQSTLAASNASSTRDVSMENPDLREMSLDQDEIMKELESIVAEQQSAVGTTKSIDTPTTEEDEVNKVTNMFDDVISEATISLKEEEGVAISAQLAKEQAAAAANNAVGAQTSMSSTDSGVDAESKNNSLNLRKSAEGNQLTSLVEKVQPGSQSPASSTSDTSSRQNTITSLTSNMSSAARPAIIVKVGVLGDHGVGKTSIINRFISQNFDRTYNSTKRVQNYEKKIVIRGNAVLFSIWDLGLRTEMTLKKVSFPTVTRESEALIYVYDLSEPYSLEALKDWYQLAMSGNPNAAPIIAGTKYDKFIELPDAERIKVQQESLAIAKELNAVLIFCSAADGINIRELFSLILSRIFNLKSNIPIRTEQDTAVVWHNMAAGR